MEVQHMKHKLITLGVSLVLISTVLLGLTGTVGALAPPAPEQPTGPAQAGINTLVGITVEPIMGTGANLFYEFDWNDTTTTGWFGPFPPDRDEPITAYHEWTTPGVYNVRVRAKNETSGEIGDWSLPHTITIGEIDEEEEGPLFAIVGVSGGTSISAAIRNMLAPSKYVDWTIEIAGGQLTGFHEHKYYQGRVFIESGKTEVITVPGPFRGLGLVKITVTAEPAGEELITEAYQGFLLFFYILNVRPI